MTAAREAAVRRGARRLGFRLRKSRDGAWAILPAPAFPPGAEGLTLERVEAFVAARRRLTNA